MAGKFAGRLGYFVLQPVEQPAEGVLAVGVAYRAVPPRGSLLVTGQLAIVGKRSSNGPTVLGKWAGVFRETHPGSPAGYG